MKTDERTNESPVYSERLTGEPAMITDDDLDYIWHKQELLLGSRIQASDRITGFSGGIEPPA